MLSKLMRCTENWSTCNWHWSTERAQFFSITTPNCTAYNQCFQNVWKLWYFAASTIFTWFLANGLPLLEASWQLLQGKTLPQPAGGRKCFPKVCQIPKPRFLCYRNKLTFLIGKNVLIIMVPILINKDMFEPSYNDLKFMIWNCIYVCTNLICSCQCPPLFYVFTTT